jgi:hypothetical protein
MLRSGLTLTAAIILAAPAWAQPVPRSTMPKFMAIIREDVQAELKLTDDQLAKVKEKVGDIVRDGPNGAKFMTVSPDMDLDGLDADIEKILNDKQRKRLRECWLQVLGIRAVLHEGIAQEVGIKPEQQKTIEQINEDQREQMREHAQFHQGEGPDPEKVQKMKSIQEEFKTKLEKVLTKEQKEKLATLKGPKFAMKPVK